MKRRFLGKKRREGALDINMTPLVDVMFILMIFLVVTAHYSTQHSIKVNLPKAQSSQKTGEQKAVVISLTKTKKIFFSGVPITAEKLVFEMKNLSKKKPQPVIIIQADEAASTGNLVDVMDAVSQAGLTKISIQTESTAQ